jgi:hypothetical protein
LGTEPRIRGTADLRPRAPRGLLLRIRTRLLRAWLDRDIARGIERPGDPALALREAQLVGARERTRLAARFERLLVPDRRASRLSSAAPVDHAAVEVARPLLTEVTRSLRSSDAVEACGVALGWRLLTDPCSPIYEPPGGRSGDLDSLWHDALSLLFALRPLPIGAGKGAT